MRVDMLWIMLCLAVVWISWMLCCACGYVVYNVVSCCSVDKLDVKKILLTGSNERPSICHTLSIPI